MSQSKKRFEEWKLVVGRLKPLPGETKELPEYVQSLIRAEKAGWTKKQFLDYMGRELPD